MNLIWLGILFVVLDLRITLLMVSFNIFPDFIGFILLYLGLRKFAPLSSHFQKGKSVAFVAILAAIVLEIISFFIIEVSISIAISIGIVRDIILFYLLYQIIKGVMDIEREEGQSYKTQAVFLLWKMLIIVDVINYLLYFSDMKVVLGIFFSFLQFALSISFMVSLYITNKLYNACH